MSVPAGRLIMVKQLLLGHLPIPMVILPPWAIHATDSLLTLSLLIWSSGLYRHALAVRLYRGQLFGSSAPGSAANTTVAVVRKQASPRQFANDAFIVSSSIYGDFRAHAVWHEYTSCHH
jgi:hypothetical protein